MGDLWISSAWSEFVPGHGFFELPYIGIDPNLVSILSKAVLKLTFNVSNYTHLFRLRDRKNIFHSQGRWSFQTKPPAQAGYGGRRRGVGDAPRNRPCNQRAGRIRAYCVHSLRLNSTLMALPFSILASAASKSFTLLISVLAMARITSPSRSPARAAAPSLVSTLTPPLS